MKQKLNKNIITLIVFIIANLTLFIFSKLQDQHNTNINSMSIYNNELNIKNSNYNKMLAYYNNVLKSLDFKIFYYCQKHDALPYFNDIRETIFNEIGRHNYDKSEEYRMSIISYTGDIGTCQFQPKTFKYLSQKYNFDNYDILNENHQIEIMVIAFKNGNQNLWMGYQKYKRNK